MIDESIRTAYASADMPVAVGFDAPNPKQAAEMATVSDGVIVGSALMKLVADHGRKCVPHVAAARALAAAVHALP